MFNISIPTNDLFAIDSVRNDLTIPQFAATGNIGCDIDSSFIFSAFGSKPTSSPCHAFLSRRFCNPSAFGTTDDVEERKCEMFSDFQLKQEGPLKHGTS